MAVKPIPEGYHSVTPYLIVKDAGKAIDYYKKAFGATEIMRFPGPNNTVAHAEIQIGDSRIMLADEGQNEYRSPQAYGGSPVSLMIYVNDVDKTFNGWLVDKADEGSKVGYARDDTFDLVTNFVLVEQLLHTLVRDLALADDELVQILVVVDDFYFNFRANHFFQLF